MNVDPFGLVGRVIENNFRVDEHVGEGGFSVVYKGFHLGLSEPIAIKAMKLPKGTEPEMVDSLVRRFRDESRIAYRLAQGSLDIVRSIAAGTVLSPTGVGVVPYMVLEWLDGMSLFQDLRARRVAGMKGRSLDEVIDLFEPAVNAVAYAHSLGVVHRDLKPANLFLVRMPRGPRLKVLDFGLAKIVDDTIGITRVQTVEAQTLCSPAYGSPEQFDRNLGPVGPWTDVYALGLILLEALSDRRVRQGEGFAQMVLQALNPNSHISCHALGIRVRPRVELAFAKAVAFSIEARHQSAQAFWDELKTAVKSRSIPAVPLSQDTIAETPQSRGPQGQDEPPSERLSQPWAGPSIPSPAPAGETPKLAHIPPVAAAGGVPSKPKVPDSPAALAQKAPPSWSQGGTLMLDPDQVTNVLPKTRANVPAVPEQTTPEMSNALPRSRSGLWIALAVGAVVLVGALVLFVVLLQRGR